MFKFIHQLFNKIGALILAATLIFSTIQVSEATGYFSLSFDTGSSQNFPAGTSIPYSINTSPYPAEGVNTFTHPVFPAGNYTMTLIIPSNTQVGSGSGYTPVTRNTLDFTLNNNQTLNLVVNIVDVSTTPPAPTTGSLSLSFDTSTSQNFPDNTSIPYSINTTPYPAEGVNTFTDPIFPVGTYILTVTLPNNDVQIGTGSNYSFITQNTARFTMNPGATLILVVNIVDLAGIGGNGDDGNVPNDRAQGRRRRTIPTITIYDRDNEVINSITTNVGEEVYARVEARSNLYGVNLTLQSDPSQNTACPASFDIQNQGQAIVTGYFTIGTVCAELNGENEFNFRADNGFQSDEVLRITVIGDQISISGPAGGVSGGSTQDGNKLPEDGFKPEDEKFQKCHFKDNQTASVVYLCMLGVIDEPTDEKDYSGNSKNNKFSGKEPMTRAAFTKIMVKITSEESEIARVTKMLRITDLFPFPDVEPLVWFAKYIALAKDNHQIHGYPNGLFIPWNKTEISEAAKILIESASKDNLKIKKDLVNSRKNTRENAAWFEKYTNLIEDYGYPKADRNVDPGITFSAKMNRQQGVDFIYTIIKNAGIEPQSKLAELKVQLARLEEMFN